MTAIVLASVAEAATRLDLVGEPLRDCVLGLKVRDLALALAANRSNPLRGSERS